MENRDFPEIGEILESIRILKTELDSIKSEIKADIKKELDSIKSDLKAEINTIKSGEIPLRDNAQTATPTPPIDDIPESEISEVFDKGSDKKTEEFTLSDFSGIYISGAFEVEIVQSDAYSVSITAEKAIFRNLHVSKEGETLKVHRSKHVSWRAQLTRPRARITLPVLKELRISGATKAAISGFDSSEAFKLDIAGASSVSGEIKAGDTVFELSGASRARLAGSGKDTIIKASGASNIDMSGFSVRNAAIRLGGASRATLKIDGRLDARLSGVSHFSWIGNPVMGDIRTSGGSRLSKQ
ncbi:MAG: DUF2807 domain-containing protein [Dehalococcoidales bacterium]|nr:MAG: DUF2807 domain-containing protein [Dehalococcoidales bacterium]